MNIVSWLAKKTLIIFRMPITLMFIALAACSPQAVTGTDANVAPVLDSAVVPALIAHPAWLKTRIAEYESQPVANPQREIFRYKFDGNTVYYTPPICCDIPSQLFSEEGKLLCYPGGGFTGRGDGRCPTFHKLKREGLLMWKDDRKRPPIEKPR